MTSPYGQIQQGDGTISSFTMISVDYETSKPERKNVINAGENMYFVRFIIEQHILHKLIVAAVGV